MVGVICCSYDCEKRRGTWKHWFTNSANSQNGMMCLSSSIDTCIRIFSNLFGVLILLYLKDHIVFLSNHVCLCYVPMTSHNLCSFQCL